MRPAIHYLTRMGPDGTPTGQASHAVLLKADGLQTILADGLLHLGEPEVTRKPYGNPARNVVRKLRQLVDFLGVGTARGDAIIDRGAENKLTAFAGVDLGDSTEYLHIKGDLPKVLASRMELIAKYGDQDLETLNRFDGLRQLVVGALDALGSRPLDGLSPRQLGALSRTSKIGLEELEELKTLPGFEGLTLLELHELTELYRVSQLDEVTVVLGSCLFHRTSAMVHTTEGTFDMVGLATSTSLTARARSIKVDDATAFYEDESLARLCRLAILVIMALLRLNPKLRVKIIVDVPHGEYYLYPYDAALNKLISLQLCLDWFDKVDERNLRVEGMYRQRLAELLDSSAGRVTLSTTDELGPVAAYLRREMQAGRLPSFEQVLRELIAHADPIMKMALAVAMPTSVRTLTGLSYVLAVLRALLSSDLVFEIENRSEGMIYAEAMRIIALILKWHEALQGDSELLPEHSELLQEHPTLVAGLLVGLYPIEKIHVTNVPRVNHPLYHHEVEHRLVLPDGTRAYAGFVLPDGTPLTRRQLLSEIYPV